MSVVGTKGWRGSNSGCYSRDKWVCSWLATDAVEGFRAEDVGLKFLGKSSFVDLALVVGSD